MRRRELMAEESGNWWESPRYADCNLIGEFTQDSTEADWTCWLAGNSGGKHRIAVNPKTKRFAEKVESPQSLKSMFLENTKLSKLYRIPSENTKEMEYLCQGCTALTDVDLSTSAHSKLWNISCILNYCSSLSSLKMDGWDLSKIIYIDTFIGKSGLEILDWGNTTGSPVNFQRMFKYAANLKKIIFNKDFNAIKGNTTVLHQEAFSGCTALQYIKSTKQFQSACWNADPIYQVGLPAAMQKGGSGTWELIDT